MHGRSSDHPVALMPDPLSEVLQDLRLSGVSYGHCELTRPWGIEFPPEKAARFHFVIAGESWLRTAALGWIRLQAGDVVLLPQGSAHALADTTHGRLKPLAELPLEEIGDRTYRLTEGGGGSRTIMTCCSVAFEEPALHPLLELMPQVMLVRGAVTEDAALPMLLETMAGEVVAPRVGAATVLARLADVVITRIIRSWVEAQTEAPTGWLAAIRDPKIGRALAAIHRRPGHSWSVEALADVARTSRSIFSERFTAAVGVSPARYLSRWRMHLASVWLRHDRLTVGEVAGRLGYESEASFSRAFKRLLGVPPSALRRVGRGARQALSPISVAFDPQQRADAEGGEQHHRAPGGDRRRDRARLAEGEE
jgi:AraC-like DNA-binding protein